MHVARELGSMNVFPPVLLWQGSSSVVALHTGRLLQKFFDVESRAPPVTQQQGASRHRRCGRASSGVHTRALQASNSVLVMLFNVFFMSLSAREPFFDSYSV